MKMWPMGRAGPSPEAAFLALALRGEQPDAPAGLVEALGNVRDWRKTAHLSLLHGISPWLLSSLARPGVIQLVPEDALGMIQGYARASVVEVLALQAALEEALLALATAGVPVAVLKGPVIAERFYPDPGLRPYGDIDLLVPLERHDRVLDACARLGYLVVEDHGGIGGAFEGTCESPLEIKLAHQESGLRLEIHYDHLQTGLRPHGLADVWARSEPWAFGPAHARALALEDLFLLLCVHLNKHGYGRLIWFKDLDLILRREGHRLDWEWLAGASREEGVIDSLAYTLRLLRKLLDTPIPEGASAVASAAGGGIFHRLLWPERDILDLRAGRWRRGVQFVPGDGPRGALPSLLVMGRRSDKLRALRRRLLRA